MFLRITPVLCRIVFLSLLCVTPTFIWASGKAKPTGSEPIGAEGKVTGTSASGQLFVTEDWFKKDVQFWVDIFSKYSTRQGVIHDALYVDRVFEVVEIGDLTPKQSRKLIRSKIKSYQDILGNIVQKTRKGEELQGEEARIYALYNGLDDPDRFIEAQKKKGIRFQLGLKDRFEAAIKKSGRYLPYMEEVFKQANLPIEITRLPFVESSFNVHARSKVGASGIWQFMRGTGKNFMKVGKVLDERNDPYVATEAAARLMAHNYEAIQDWPLAITAYNHGKEGILRAVRKVGERSLRAVLENHRSRSFGFASRNFYFEFLAAVEVERNSVKYFGPIEREQPIAFKEIQISKARPLTEALKLLGSEAPLKEEIMHLNLGLSAPVWTEKVPVPAGTRLRYPAQAQTAAQSTLNREIASESPPPTKKE